MSYRLEQGEPIANGIKRIAGEQIEKALDHLVHAPDGRDEAVHEARKCFKKVRAVLRLVRDEIGEEVYKPENVCYRDAGRVLSDVRDSNVMVETLDDLTEWYADQLDLETFSTVRARLVERHHLISKQILDEQNAMTKVASTIQTARGRLDDLPIENKDFSAFYDGLKRVYKRGRKRLADAYNQPKAENFHEWRKRVKYLWYHTRILRPAWPDPFKTLADEIHDLSDYLGDEHDLTELRETIIEEGELCDDEKTRLALIALIDRRREAFRADARPLGEKIYVEKPKDFVNRVEEYWQA